MARFDADGNGTILKFVPSVGAEKVPILGAPAPDRVFYLQFDEETNPALVTAYQGNPSQWSLPGGTLTQTVAGQPTPATVNPPSTFYKAFLNAAGILSRLNGGQYAPTQEELSQIAAAAFRAIGYA